MMGIEFDEKTKINFRVQKRYGQLMAEGKHGHYETIFKLVHEERANALKPFLNWYDADNADAITITRSEMGVLVGRHPHPTLPVIDGEPANGGSGK